MSFNYQSASGNYASASNFGGRVGSVQQYSRGSQVAQQQYSRGSQVAVAQQGASCGGCQPPSASAAAPAKPYNSAIEQQVIQARAPIEFNEREQATVGQFTGTLLNKQEIAQFRGPIPLEQYRINDDQSPELIKKRLDKVKYTQEVAVRYLQPPPAPKPGDLIVKERQQQVPPAPPVVLRQEGDRANTPAPLVLRQRPPQAPARIPEQVVEVEGAPVPPPARRVVIEKVGSLPPKPQNILIEKWLPYQPQRRRVVLQRSCAAAPQNPRNLIIEWEAPEVEVERVCRNLGVQPADPEEYIRRYGNELKDASQLPAECDEKPQVPSLPPPAAPSNQCGCNGQAAAPLAQFRPAAGFSATFDVPELEGDVEALRRVDLQKYNLGQYRAQLGQ